MKKVYTAPSLYAENLDMHPIIGTDCANGIFDLQDFQYLQAGSITRDELLANDKSLDGELELNYANPYDCYGAHYEVGMIGPNGMYATFHTKSGVVSMCDNLSAIEDLPYPVSFYENTCYNVPTFVLLNFASF